MTSRGLNDRFTATGRPVLAQPRRQNRCGAPGNVGFHNVIQPKYSDSMLRNPILRPLRALGVAALALISVTALAGPDRGADARNFPSLQLQEHARGQQALNVLGANLSSVAQSYGLDSTRLRDMLTSDQTLAVDRDGRLHYSEPAGNAVGATTVAGGTFQLLVALEDTFKLHSRPTAKRIIYLDFTGHVLTGTAWNRYSSTTPATIVAPPWSIDSDTSTFNDQERTIIQRIWQRVAEDYSPFDVDVTTELTSEDQITRSDFNDQYYGSRALISPISSYFGYYGGIAYVGVFDSVGDYYKPALVFPENLGPNGESYIAEAISHEVGHNLGLNHDGTTTGCGSTGTSPCGYYSGQGIWAPIMGVGYYVSLVQWSKGEYATANNTQDDLSIIAGSLGYRADDHGNTAAAATFLPSGPQLSAAGVITSSADIDVFAFLSGDGPAVINLNPDNLSPNLDILAELRDSAGNLVASSNPTGSLSASFNLNLDAGTYFLFVRGTGEGAPNVAGYSSYGSIGQYTLTGTVATSGPQSPIAVATATPAVVAVGQPITFNGSDSFDPDGGDLVSYDWSFSDGAIGSGAAVTKSFDSPGNYVATLTVADDEASTASTVVSVKVNDPPAAGITVSPGAAGVAPFPVSFSGASSTDSDGSIVNYAWKFGDGSSGSGLNVSKTYNAAGSYTAQLTVTDNNGATSVKTIPIAVNPNPASGLKIQSITLVLTGNVGNRSVKATIKVTNLNGVAVSNANVSGTWSGAITGSQSDNSDNSGISLVTSAKTKKTGLATFTITNVTKNGYTYNAANNVVTSASINVQ